MKKAFATTAGLALALIGCQSASQPSGEDGVGTLKMNLTLPDGTVINEITYTVTGTALSMPRTDTVDFANSTQPRFRVGNLPVATGYNMELAATTTDGVTSAVLRRRRCGRRGRRQRRHPRQHRGRQQRRSGQLPGRDRHQRAA
jgi:hypothetical protein